MTTYQIEPEKRTLHGYFSPDLPHVLEVEPGDTVIFRTLDAGWGLEPHDPITGDRRIFEPQTADLDKGHALCGPVAIKGAEPGATLEVVINEIAPGPFGTTYAGGWDSPTNNALRMEARKLTISWSLDSANGVWRAKQGYVVPVRPFMGVMGMPTEEAGVHSTAPPRRTGGNIDCKELVAGSSLFLPVAVSGGLFSVGDGHGLQADGEVSGTAIECPVDRVSLTFKLHTDMRIEFPRANTPAGWITFGFSKDLNEATIQALDGMLQLMQEEHGLERVEALALASLLVDMRVTQIVNGVRGVHAVLPHDALQVVADKQAGTD